MQHLFLLCLLLLCLVQRDVGLPKFNTHNLENLTPGIVESMNLSV